ncbi:hypothetical protein [uncultured Jatrophihabitans sp.]|uniref:hypothetical protein n=1 Tax=uncultured Jatrophihabitans sp. TaxID=1610747 RepID=UPI0035CC58F4
MRSWSDEASAHVARLLPDADLGRVEKIQRGPRSSVHRVRLRAGGSVIVKWFNGMGEGWVREAAALSLLHGDTGAPHLLAESGDPPIVVMSDLGDGPSLSDALLGRDAAAAEATLALWAQALGRLHVATRGLRADFQTALTARAGELPVYDAHLGADLDDAIRVLDRECGSLGVSVPAGAFDELRGLGARLGGDTLAAITPGDTCPDNNLVHDDRLTLLDFENAQWRHVAWDVAYLTVPWPTCWCAWTLTPGAAQRAVDAYVALVRDAFPAVRTAAFADDVRAAQLGWVFLSVSWYLGASRDDKRLRGGRRPAHPGKLEVMLHRLREAAQDGAAVGSPALAELAQHLGDELTRRWGAVPLELAPAFRRADPVRQ